MPPRWYQQKTEGEIRENRPPQELRHGKQKNKSTKYSSRFEDTLEEFGDRVPEQLHRVSLERGIVSGESSRQPQQTMHNSDPGYSDLEIVLPSLGSQWTVRVAYTAQAVQDWIESYSYADSITFGVDIEWRPNRRGENNKAALLQIAGPHGCLIVQLMYLDRIPDSLRNLLIDPNQQLAGVRVTGDTKKLFQDYGLKCDGEVDLGLLAADVLDRRNLKQAGLAKLCELVLGIPLDKDQTLRRSDWAVRDLSLQQINYAASDAIISFVLGCSLLDSWERQRGDALLVWQDDPSRPGHQVLVCEECIARQAHLLSP